MSRVIVELYGNKMDIDLLSLGSENTPEGTVITLTTTAGEFKTRPLMNVVDVNDFRDRIFRQITHPVEPSKKVWGLTDMMLHESYDSSHVYKHGASRTSILIPRDMLPLEMLDHPPQFIRVTMESITREQAEGPQNGEGS